MNVFRYFQDEIVRVLDELARDGRLPPGLDASRVAVEPPRDPAHGDVSTNAAMVLAKPAGMKPRDLADALASLLRKAGFAVCREYYINDAGAQVDILARSLHLRYREALGEPVGAVPEASTPASTSRRPRRRLSSATARAGRTSRKRSGS